MEDGSVLPKERVIAALEFQNPDRVPIGELGVDYPVTEQALGRPTLYRAKWKEFTALWQGRRDEYVASCKRDIPDLARKFEHDFVPVFLVPSRHKKYPVPEFLSEYKWRYPDGRTFACTQEAEGPILVDMPEVTLDQIQDLPVEVDESELELVRHVVKEMGSTHFILGRPGGGVFPFDRYLLEFLILGLLEQPECIKRIIEVETRYVIAVGNILLDAGCDGVAYHSDLAGNNGPFMSPGMFREFIFPWLKAECDAAHAKGKYLIKHTDGNTWLILDLMLEAGIDAWQGIQPRLGMGLPELQQRYGGRLCFWGGVDVDTLVAGSEEEVVEQVRIACASAPREGGLVLTSGNTLMVGVKYSNYLAMLQAAKRYGRFA